MKILAYWLSVSVVGIALGFVGMWLLLSFIEDSVLDEPTAIPPAPIVTEDRAAPTPSVRCIFVIDPPNAAGVGPMFLIPPKDFAPPPPEFMPMWLCAGPDTPLRYYSEPQGDVANAPALREEFN